MWLKSTPSAFKESASGLTVKYGRSSSPPAAASHSSAGMPDRVSGQLPQTFLRMLSHNVSYVVFAVPSKDLDESLGSLNTLDRQPIRIFAVG